MEDCVERDESEVERNPKGSVPKEWRMLNRHSVKELRASTLDWSAANLDTLKIAFESVVFEVGNSVSIHGVHTVTINRRQYVKT